MNRLILLLSLLSLPIVIFAQVNVEILHSDCELKKYRILWPMGYIDTLRYNMSSKLRSYDNGQKFDDISYDSTSWVTSVKRYHQTGALAFEGYVLCCDSLQIKLKKESKPINQNKIPDYFYRTYYDNGALRSSEFYSFKEGKLSSQKIFYDLKGKVRYNEVITKSDTVQGTFYVGRELENYKFAVYEQGQLLEIWFLNNPYDNVVTVDKIVEFKNNKEKIIRRKKKLLRKIEMTPLIHVTCVPCVQNS